MSTLGYAVDSPTGKFHSFSFERREAGDDDVIVDILYCGVCHTDIHLARNHWGNSLYPLVPGHEIAGKVIKVGKNVRNVKPGDNVGVSVVVNSCRKCDSCNDHFEQFCPKAVLTINGNELDGTGPTRGGYSKQIVVDSYFVFPIPRNLDFKSVAPLLCAGITVYTPLVHWKSQVEGGKKVAINGLGGLGHLALQIAVALGAEVTVISTSNNKEADARRLGAVHFLDAKDEETMKKAAGSFDLILDTVTAKHSWDALVGLLRRRGVLIVVSIPEENISVSPFALVMGDKVIAGSGAGGVKETNEMLEFCAKNNIVCKTETIGVHQIEEAYERILKNDVKFRFVIDMETLKN